MIATPLVDYRVHSQISPDARSTIDEMCSRAVELNMTEIGFSEHVEFQPKDPGYRFFDYVRYTQLIELARTKYKGRLIIRKGAEIDYTYEYEAQTREWLEGKDFDFLIDAVHYIDDISFDLRGDLAMPVSMATQKYFAKIGQAVESGLFKVIGHFDLIRDYLPRDEDDFSPLLEEIDTVFEKIVEKKVHLEINSRRNAGGEPYPSRSLILRYLTKGGEFFSFGSDAHSTQDLAVGIAEIMGMLMNHGNVHILFQ